MTLIIDAGPLAALADCSLVVAAHAYRTTRILSFDERRLRAIAPIAGGTFTLVPADAGA